MRKAGALGRAERSPQTSGSSTRRSEGHCANRQESVAPPRLRVKTGGVTHLLLAAFAASCRSPAYLRVRLVVSKIHPGVRRSVDSRPGLLDFH